jgi:hypothetical protein
MAQQLALDLGGAPPASLANFIGNTEVVRALNELLDSDCLGYGQQNIYLCGPPGSGRTHLLAAACAHVQRQGQMSCSLGSFIPSMTLSSWIICAKSPCLIYLTRSCQANKN